MVVVQQIGGRICGLHQASVGEGAGYSPAEGHRTYSPYPEPNTSPYHRGDYELNPNSLLTC